MRLLRSSLNKRSYYRDTLNFEVEKILDLLAFAYWAARGVEDAFNHFFTRKANPSF